MNQQNLDAFLRQVASQPTLWRCAALFADGHLNEAAARLASMGEALGYSFDPGEFARRAAQFEPS